MAEEKEGKRRRKPKAASKVGKTGKATRAARTTKAAKPARTAKAPQKPRRPLVGVKNLEGKVVKRISLPKVFDLTIRDDVVRKVAEALRTHRLQSQGRDVMAGKRTSAESVGVGRGLARVPRVKGSMRAAIAPGTVGGRQAHPPTAERNVWKRVNRKERLLALRSAIAATASIELVAKRGHEVTGAKVLPMVVSEDVQSLTHTREVEGGFRKLGLWSDVVRVRRGIKVRGGKARLRGRGYKVGKGPLIVVSEDKGVGKAARNIPGVDVVKVKDLNVELLAPGTHIGRLTLWDEASFKALDSLYLREEEVD